ncbi:MAG: Hsp33 family molecular chaperone HslO [Acidobacteria bacterium]|nr:Hsp33 family molecular chaperone HslO [Acidobacteriota bacterium]
MPDHLIHAVAFNQTVRALAAVTTGTVSEAARRHRTSPTASAALGRTLTGALLMSTMVKDVDRVTLQFDCRGPIEGITAEADAHGNARGYVKNPAADLPLNERGKLDVRGVLGDGMLYVFREGGFYELGLSKEPYTGSVPIVSGEIAEDIAYYLNKSEQVRSAVSLGVYVQPYPDGTFQVAGAGGFLIQLLPGADEGIISGIEESISSMPYVTDLIRQGEPPEAILRRALNGSSLEVLEQRETRFRCNCSFERAVRIIESIQISEVRSMLEEDGGAEMICHFCSSVYQIGAQTLQDILDVAGQEADGGEPVH